MPSVNNSEKIGEYEESSSDWHLRDGDGGFGEYAAGAGLAGEWF